MKGALATKHPTPCGRCTVRARPGAVKRHIMHGNEPHGLKMTKRNWASFSLS